MQVSEAFILLLCVILSKKVIKIDGTVVDFCDKEINVEILLRSLDFFITKTNHCPVYFCDFFAENDT